MVKKYIDQDLLFTSISQNSINKIELMIINLGSSNGEEIDVENLNGTMVDKIIEIANSHKQQINEGITKLSELTTKEEYTSERQKILDAVDSIRTHLIDPAENTFALRMTDNTSKMNIINSLKSELDAINIPDFDTLIKDANSSFDNSTSGYTNGILGIIHMSHQNGAKNNPRADYENKSQLLTQINMDSRYVLQESETRDNNKDYTNMLLSSRNSPHLYVIISGFIKLPDNLSTVSFDLEADKGAYMKLNNQLIIKNNYAINPPWMNKFPENSSSSEYTIFDLKNVFKLTSKLVPFQIHASKPHNKLILKWNINGQGLTVIPEGAFYHNASENDIYVREEYSEYEHYGCYSDSSSRDIPGRGGTKTFDEAVIKASEMNLPYFGLQWTNGLGKQKAEFWYPRNGEKFGIYGKSPNCIKMEDGSSQMGGFSWANSVYVKKGINIKDHMEPQYEHYGCYGDNGSRDIVGRGGRKNYKDAHKAAVGMDLPYFGLQWTNGLGKKQAEFWYPSPKDSDKFGSYGTRTSCIKMEDGSGQMGGYSWANSVYVKEGVDPNKYK